ncbi:MAG: hypothetical protein HXK20_01320 [Alloprevotella tannerae]|nr:hypothetical protein [Alloprevotella tannerae]
MRKLLFTSASLLSLLIIACLGACDRFGLDADKYILTNKDGDTIMIQEGMQPDTFYARGYKTFNMKNVAIYKGEKLLTQVTQTAGVYSKDLGEVEFEKDGNIRKLVIYNWCMVERITMKKGKIGYKVSALGPSKGYTMACRVTAPEAFVMGTDVMIK